MAYPPLRSMNASLYEGATDGRYKKVRPDTECAITDDLVKNLTYEVRDDLSLPYYGIGEKRTLTVPAGPSDIEMPDYYKNKLEEKVQSGIMGQTW
jgi:hypothetical protein